jgi:ArsR family transcriptional regulator
MRARNKDRCGVTKIEEERVVRAQAQLIDGLRATRLASFYKALSDPTRVRIISALSPGELCVCDIAATLGMTQSAISHQLRVLRELRLVKRRRQGQMAYYSVDDEHVSALFAQGLSHLEHG